MPSVVALYRFPVKGFTAESLSELTVQPDGRIAGDRVLTFRFGDATAPEHKDGRDYWSKSKGLSLQDFPTLARLSLSYDEQAKRVRITEGSTELVEAGLDPAGRDQLTAAITEFVLASPEARRLGKPGRLPLVLVGDGETSRFQDSSRGYISVHSEASVAEIAAYVEPEVDDRRFRSNVVIAGVDPRTELSWDGNVRIGDVTFNTDKNIVRCLATHCNPDTGVRDAKLLTAFTQQLGMTEPTLGRFLLPMGEPGVTTTGGVIRVGDEVTF